MYNVVQIILTQFYPHNRTTLNLRLYLTHVDHVVLFTQMYVQFLGCLFIKLLKTSEVILLKNLCYPDCYTIQNKVTRFVNTLTNELAIQYTAFLTVHILHCRTIITECHKCCHCNLFAMQRFRSLFAAGVYFCIPFIFLLLIADLQ